jgi:hypothetical protein
MRGSGTSVGEITGHSKKISSVDFKQVANVSLELRFFLHLTPQQTRPFRIATCGDDFQVA